MLSLESAFPSCWHNPAASVQGTGKSTKAGYGGRNFPLAHSWFLTRMGAKTSPLVQVSILCMADSQRCHKTHRTPRSHRQCPKRRDGGAEAARSSDREGISCHNGKSVLKFFNGTFPSWHFNSSHHNLISGGPQAENARCGSWLEKT